MWKCDHLRINVLSGSITFSLILKGQLGFSYHLVLSRGFQAPQSTNDLSDIFTAETLKCTHIIQFIFSEVSFMGIV